MRPTISVFQDDLIGRIVTEAKRILEEIGLEIRGPELRRQLLDSGLKQDPASGRLLLPPDAVDNAITSAPKSFALYDRNGKVQANLGGDRIHFVPGSSGLKVLDRSTGRARPATTADFVDYVRVADGLQHLAYLATAFSTNDVEASISDAWRLYLCLTNSLKPVVSGAFTEHGVPRMARMMALFRRDKADLIARPMSIFTVTATGFFRYGEDSCQNLLDCLDWGIPIEIVPVTLMGLIAPVTLVGAAVMHVADVLGGLTMAQILKPGTPVLFGGAPATFHMSLATSPMAAIEAQRLNVAYAAVGKWLGLPTQAYMALSDGKVLDAQAGAETFGSGLLAALAGINSISGPGLLDYVLVFSLEKLVFDNELCGQILQFVRDVQPLQDLPTVDLVRQLLAEQHLLTAPHTREHWPAELYLPGPVIDRQTREDWLKLGQPSLWQRAQAEVEEGLRAHTPVLTDRLVDGELQRLLRSGLTAGGELPAVPDQSTPPTADISPPRRQRRQNRRKPRV